MSPALEWWNDNYRLLCDALVRRYPLHMVSYASVLERPEQAVKDTLQWVGGGDIGRAITEVRSHMRTQRVEALSTDAIDLPGDIASVCDELYARVHEQRALDAAFIGKLNETHEKLEQPIRAAEAKARASRKRVRALREANRLREKT
jgi:hypothetical protein